MAANCVLRDEESGEIRGCLLTFDMRETTDVAWTGVQLGYPGFKSLQGAVQSLFGKWAKSVFNKKQMKNNEVLVVESVTLSDEYADTTIPKKLFLEAIAFAFAQNYRYVVCDGNTAPLRALLLKCGF